MKSFKRSSGLAEAVLTNVKKAGLKKPTAIQCKAIPEILRKKDVLGIAKTGTGKTASFVLPILTRLQESFEQKNRHVSTLVVVPTRELAVQVSEVFKEFSIDLPQRVKTMAVYGGVSINPQMKDMQNVSVLVATPGRLLELIEAKAVSISEVKMFVMDEADKLLNKQFEEEMSQIFAQLPVRRQTMLFSATLTDQVDKLNGTVLRNPTVVKAEEEVEVDLELIEQTAYFSPDEKKGPLLRHLIKSKEMKQVLVFTSSVYQADNVANKLRKNGIKATAVHSKKAQRTREESLRDFKLGKIPVLVATDLLARGIDIEFLPFVINYELPRSPKDYVHRIGRTGRAENPGQAITIVSPDEEQHFRTIQKKMKRWVDRVDIDLTDLY